MLQDTEKEYAFSESTVRLVETLAGSMSVALENAQLFDEVQTRNREITEALERETASNDILRVIAESPTDIQPVLNVIAQNAAQLSGSEDVIIATKDGDVLRIVSHFGDIPMIPIGEGIHFDRYSVAGRAMIEGRPIQAIHNQPGVESEFPEGDKVAEKFGYRASNAVPLMREGKAVGVITIRRRTPELLTDNQIELIQSFANQAAIAVENVRLFDETQRLLKETEERNAELAVINSVQEGLASKLDIQEIYDLVGDKLREIFKADTCFIAFHDEDRTTVTAPYYADKTSKGPLSRPYGKGIYEPIVESGKPLVLGSAEDANNIGRYDIKSPGASKDLNESVMGVPIFKDGKAIGATTIQSYEKNAYSESDIRLLQTLTNSMSVALESARLFDETTQRNAELAIVNSVSEAMTKNLDVQTVVKIVGDKVQQIFDADMVAIGFINEEQGVTEVPYSYALGKYFEEEPFPLGDGLAGIMFRTQQPLLLNTAKEIADRGSVKTEADRSADDLIQTWLGVPIIIGDKLIGGVSIQSYQAYAYDDNDQRLLSTLGANMGAVIENARLFEETKHLLKETEERNAELAVINSVQEALAAQLDLQGIYDAVGDKIRDIFDAQSMIIGTLDHQTKMAHAKYFYEKGKRYFPDSFAFSGLIEHIVETGEKIVINENMTERSKELNMITEGESPLSGVWIPYKTGTQVRGIISLQNMDYEHAFSESDIRLLDTLANSMSVALENARLFDELQSSHKEISEALERQTAISEILHIISNSPGEIQPVLQAVAEHAAKLCEADDVQIYRTVGDELMEIAHFGPLPALRASETLPLDPGLLTARAILEQRTIHVDAGDLSAEEYPISVDLQNRLKHRSVIITPLIREDEAIGGIVARRNEVREFSQNQVNLLSTFANQAAIAIENVRLFEETKRLLAESMQQAEELQSVNTVSTALSSELGLEALIELIGEQVQKIFDADIAYLALLDKDSGYIEFPYSYGEEVEKLKFGEGLTSRVMQNGEPLLINRDEDWSKTKKRIGVESQSYLGVPISVGKEVIGVISVQSTQLTNMYGEKEVRLLSTIAANIGAAIQNANLFNEVERQKEYFETLISSAPVAIITIGLDGHVTSWSPAAESLFGYTEEEAVGANIDDLVSNHPDVRDEAEKLTQQYLSDIGKIQLKSQRTHKDGHLIDVAINAMPVNIEGVVSGYIAIYNDISELEKARRDAEEANHAKSAFLANMSHELRTPLNAIIGFTRIVKRKGDKILPDKQIENLDKVLVSAEHLLGLINTVLDISKIEAGRMEVHATNFDLKSLINLVSATTQPLLKDGNVAFRTELPDDLPMVNSDIEKIKQVLINLVSNAAKFTNEGEITLEVRRVNEQIEIDVTDTGIGISPEALEHIFEEFQQADSSTTREYGGTGLGLSISRSLARLLEGDLRVESEVGVGSTFTFSFPISYGQQEEVPSAEPLPVDSSGDEPLILVIDDNQDAIYLMREMLEAAGYRVAVARDGDEGLSLAGELTPYAITLDIMMPKKDGWQVLHDLKSNSATKSIPVILISIVDQKALGYRLGAEDYLVKPLQEDEILQSLQSIKRRGGDRPLKRLLVVDDDPTVEDMISQLLEGKQYQVESASDGLDALEKIRADKPDAILLDLMMPRLDGLGLIERLKQDPELADLPVIVLTAKLLNQKEKEALKASVGQVIQKQGISGEELLSEIRETIKNAV